MVRRWEPLSARRSPITSRIEPSSLKLNCPGERESASLTRNACMLSGSGLPGEVLVPSGLFQPRNRPR